MIKKNTFLNFFFVIFFLAPLAVAGQEFKTISYEESELNFPNPERGFLKHTSTHSDNYDFLSESTLGNYIKIQNITLVWRNFYLEGFVEAAISDEYLDNMQTDFDVMRAAGVKAIVRFAYTNEFENGFDNPPYNDATPAQVLDHIAQLKPILQANIDVIAVVQAGFIGTWGEWFYTDHYTTSGDLDNPNDADWENRKDLIDELLDAVPESRMLQVRYPVGKFLLVDSEEPLTEAEAYNGSIKARLGHHNDCFVSSSTDIGTYRDIDAEKEYLEQDTKYLAMGGETCNPSSRSNCTTTTEEMARFHWDFINIDYHPDIINQWKDEGCMEEIRRRLGYRFRLVTTEIQEAAKPGDAFNITLNLKNDGWASTYNPRDVQIMLRGSENGGVYFAEVDEDPRFWMAGEMQNITFQAGISEDMPEGNYDVFLNLPDPETAINKNPNYSIRLANTGVWEAVTGYNALLHQISIDGSASSEDYGGELFFEELAAATTEDLDVPGSFSATTSLTKPTTRIDLTWQDIADETSYVLSRSEDGENFVQIDVVEADETTYADKNLGSGVQYFYKIQALNAASHSPFSEIANATTEEEVVAGFGDSLGDNNSALIRSYPNPFSDQMTLEVQLVHQEEINITVHDMYGRIVQNLFNGMAKSGLNKFIWNGQGADGSKAPGVYILSVSSNRKIGFQTFKVTVQ